MAEKFEVAVVTINEFFDVKYYAANNTMQWEVLKSSTMLTQALGFVNTY
jgi:hypothetical protein